MKKLLIFAIATLGMFACTGKNDPKDPSNDSATITCNPTTKTVVVLGDEFTVTITSNIAWSATTDKPWVTITPYSGQGDAFVTVKVTAGDNDEARVLFSNGNSSAMLIVYRKGGMLPGKFSVSASKQVHFSPGNLQYQASTQIWRFAEKQYDIIGSDNANISASYNGWIDLFGWGTGENPTYASDNINDYITFVDWGTNAISNGGNKANQWRTLKKDEWVYLFFNRKKAANLFGLGSVSSIKGLIILPDDWTTPAGVSFIPSISDGWTTTSTAYISDGDASFSHNIYLAAQWSIMESAGAVFLPIAGDRYGLDVRSDGTSAHYWSSTPSSSDYGDSVEAYHLLFHSLGIYPQSHFYRLCGNSVRLVKDIE